MLASCRRIVVGQRIARRAMASLSGGAMLKEMAQDMPHKDVVRYAHKNRKWTLKHVDYYSEALAVGLVENGLQPGDVLLSWLPSHFSEQMVLQFACSKSGLIMYSLDPANAQKDQDIAKESISKALELTQANVLISQEAGQDVNYVRLLKDVIPELNVFDFADGMPFITPKFPHLRFPVHTGMDQDDKWGLLPLHHLIVPSDNLEDFVPAETITGGTPLLGELICDDQGVPTGVGKTKTNEQVFSSKEWPTYASILQKEYHEVGGVGNVW